MQPDQKSCVSTCVAMLLGVPATGQQLVRFQGDYFDDRETASSFLRRKGMKNRALLTEDRTMNFGRVYILSVPSLNNVGGMHAIVVDMRDVMEIYDPQKGTGKKYYGTDGDGQELVSYNLDVVVDCYDHYRDKMDREKRRMQDE